MPVKLRSHAREGNGRPYGDSTDQTSGSIELSFDGNCTDLTISAEWKTGLAWQPWQTLFRKENSENFPVTEIDILGKRYKIEH